VTSGRVCTKYCKMEGIIHEILGEIGDSKWVTLQIQKS
jgi:hypothetical protein